jgi:putative hydrolase of the HAD superfamily
VPTLQKGTEVEPRRVHAVIFDLGSTLIYFDGDIRQIFLQAHLKLSEYLEKNGAALDKEYFLREFAARMIEYYVTREAETTEYTTGYILKNLMEEMGHKGYSEESLRPALRVMYSVSQAHWKIEKETWAALQELKERGYHLAIISNAGDDEDVQTLIDNAKIRGFFDVILTSAALGIRKPNPLIFQKVLDRMGMKPEQAVMVGDRLGADIFGALQAGMRGILITRRADPDANSPYKEQVIPDAVIENLGELPEILAKLEA